MKRTKIKDTLRRAHLFQLNNWALAIAAQCLIWWTVGSIAFRQGIDQLRSSHAAWLVTHVPLFNHLYNGTFDFLRSVSKTQVSWILEYAYRFGAFDKPHFEAFGITIVAALFLAIVAGWFGASGQRLRSLVRQARDKVLVEGFAAQLSPDQFGGSNRTSITNIIKKSHVGALNNLNNTEFERPREWAERPLGKFILFLLGGLILQALIVVLHLVGK